MMDRRALLTAIAAGSVALRPQQAWAEEVEAAAPAAVEAAAKPAVAPASQPAKAAVSKVCPGTSVMINCGPV